jgi:hypothetical protein
MDATTSILSVYTIYKNRNDMTAGQYIQYTNDWNTFQRVWNENYKLSTIGSTQRYTFATYTEYQMYLRGQNAHVDVYDSNSPGRILSTIHVINQRIAPANQFVNIR